ncbi:MAG: glycosyltransferase family 2 protein [Acidisphaera sp.]|nr:glycosyltransferase family 2 protein [Acidisphaera sp.]
MGAADHRPGRIAIVLSTFNGERFLPRQLDSLLQQTHGDWRLYWRDDGSSDATVELLEAFSRGPAAGRCVRVHAPAGRVGATQSFMALLAAAGEEDAVAFADQDDVWLPEKLARGCTALSAVARETPALYCARQVLVDEELHRLGVSFRLARPPGFPMALTQNIATGCTVMLNRQSASLVAASRAPPATVHDWWSYLLVSAAGGRLLVDDEPVVLYRQHSCNLVGAPHSAPRRAMAALRRGPGLFMTVFRQHVAALWAQRHLLSRDAAAEVAAIRAALEGGMLQRARVLRRYALERQTGLETLLFRWWFLIG